MIDLSAIWVDMLANGGRMKYLDGFFTVQGIYPDDTYDADALKSLYGPLPSLESIKATRKVKPVRELLRAWDPQAQKIVWEHETSSGIRGYDGGVMSTAGNLVFQGRGSGGLWIYAADTGKVLKVINTGSHIMAAPMTYSVSGEQFRRAAGRIRRNGHYRGDRCRRAALRESIRTPNRIIAFKLGGGEVPTPAPRVEPAFAKPPAATAAKAQIDAGEIKFVQECSRCHTFGPSSTPDLRKLNDGLHAAFKDIVLKGALAPTGNGALRRHTERDRRRRHSRLPDRSELDRVPGTRSQRLAQVDADDTIMPIRRAAPADVAGVSPLVEHYWQFESIGGFDRLRVETLLRRLIFEPERGGCWVAEEGGALRGYLLAVVMFSPGARRPDGGDRRDLRGAAEPVPWDSERCS